jgi:Cellulase (glycosyl hydrolase family 5)
LLHERPLPCAAPRMRRLLPLSLALLAAVLALPTAASASPRQVVSFEAPRELMSASTREATLSQIAAFGVTRIRQLVYWKSYAPQPRSKRKPRFDAADPNAYPAGTWSGLDALVASAEARGISVQLTLTGPVPKWAARGHRDYLTAPNTREFRLFATAVGRRYGDQVSMWSIWNEPNQPQFLLPQYHRGRPVSPRIYRGLYEAGYAGIRATAANAHDKILIGETSPRGNSHVVHPLVFLRGMLCLNARYHRAKSCRKLPADGYAHHAYTTSTGPRFHPPSRDDVTIGVLPRLVRALDRAARAGALPRHLPIYLTEFGIQSYPDRISGVSLARQAAYLGISEHIAYVNPRVAAFSQYLMSDDPPRHSGYRYGGFESGLRTWKGKAKPAYAAFRLPLAVEVYGGSDVLWGLVRPYRATTRVTILSALPHRRFRTLKTLTTTATGVYGLRTRHHRGQRFRVRWTAPDGHVYMGPSIRAY